jgi:hypothetical protein
MQQKESKTSKHFWYSISKSVVRVIAFGCLAYQDFAGTAVLLTLAELLGIAEEF